jgi:hypothetical protein
MKYEVVKPLFKKGDRSSARVRVSGLALQSVRYDWTSQGQRERFRVCERPYSL